MTTETLRKPVTRSSEADASPERISHLSESLSSSFDSSLKEISKINLQSRLLSFNAQVEAARAGEFGASFSVVAAEMQKLSQVTEKVASKLESEAKTTVSELKDISQLMATNVRGTRLNDLAFVNIDLIDRNLYERTCDVRWWATDSAIVSALQSGEPADTSFASKRLGIILDAYTVYYDIVLCDKDGNVVANGRPQKYHSVGKNYSNTPWFKESINARSGDEFGFQSVTQDSLANGALTLVYSCGVYGSGGETLGVMGIVFNWEGLAQTIMKSTPVDAARKNKTRCCIIDKNKTILADSHDATLTNLNHQELNALMNQEKAFTKATLAGKPCYIAHAAAPGFETYSTGWHSVLIQEI